MGLVKPATPPKQSFTQVFGQWLCDQAAADPRLVGITPAMREGSGLVEFEQQFPDRYFDVGIAEQHAVTVSPPAWPAEGLKPVVAIYSTFLQRAYDQPDPRRGHPEPAGGVLHWTARAWWVPMAPPTPEPATSPTCAASPTSAWPARPMKNECRQLLSTAFAQDHSVAVRYPRGAGAGIGAAGLETLPLARVRFAARAELPSWPLARCCTRRWRRPTPWAPRWSTCAGPNRWTPNCWRVARSHQALVTVEGLHHGRAGSAVCEALQAAGLTLPVLQLGLKDAFIEHGDPAKLQAVWGLDAPGIQAAIARHFGALLAPVARAA